MDDSLVLAGVTQQFGERKVLEGVNLTVASGRIVGLLGPNGAGKSTLMRILFGVVEPDSGTVVWNGRPATAADRRSWGYMPQERGLYPTMRIRDHIVWLGRLHGMSVSSARDRTDQLLERLDLTERAGDEVQDLSGGMAQRVQLAAAMVHEPQLLVLDEPFSGLDPGGVDFLTSVLFDHVRAGRHLIFSSHQLDLVEDICDSIALLDRGRIVLEGDLSELRTNSQDRFLHVDVAVPEEWIVDASVSVASTNAAGSRLLLAPGTDAGDVLDLVRCHVSVGQFSVEAPSVAELFRAAVERQAA